MNRTLCRSRIAILLLCEFTLASCKSEAGLPPVVRMEPASVVQATKAPQPAVPQQNATATAPASAVTQASWTPDALEELLAPVALYPDQLLGQILAASINSQEVMDGGNWLLQNQSLKGNDLDAAAQKAGFGPAMRALVQYPSVLDMMCQEIDWTRQLGSAFNSDQKSVLDAVQRLRKEAADVGNLKSNPQQTVSTKTESGNVYIEVKPADPKIVYVPQYDPQVVYTTPPPPGTTTTTTTTTATGTTTSTSTTTAATTETKKEEKDGVSTGAAVATALIAFGVGVAVGSSMNDDYYYPHWGAGVYYGPRPFYPPAYVYRPVYGPAFRPAYGYASPPGYRHNYNNVRVNNNIVINNNNNYYNRFDNNQNLRTGGTRSPLANSQQRVGQTGTPGTAANWKGQSSYAGARNSATNTRAGQTAGASRPANTQAARPANASAAQPGDRSAARTGDAAPHVDRGYGDSTRTASRPATATPAARPSQPTASPSVQKKDSAFSSAKTQGGGNFDRAASARGQASVGARQTSGGRVNR